MIISVKSWILVGAMAIAPVPVAQAADGMAQPHGSDRPVHPDRIVSINMCVDELALMLVPDDRLISVTRYVQNPDVSLLADLAADKIPNAGRAEEVFRLKPDIVLAGQSTTPFARSLLKKMDIRLVEIPPPESVEDIRASVRTLAAAVGEVARGEQIIERMNRDIEKYTHSYERPVRTVIYQEGGITLGGNRLLNEILHLAGLANVADELGVTTWSTLPLESLLKGAPELIITSEYRPDTNSLRRLFFTHPAFRRLARQHTTLSLNAKYWLCGTPVITQALEKLSRAGAALRNSAQAVAQMKTAAQTDESRTK